MALHLDSGLLRYNRFARGRSRPAIPKTVTVQALPDPSPATERTVAIARSLS